LHGDKRFLRGLQTGLLAREGGDGLGKIDIAQLEVEVQY